MRTRSPSSAPPLNGLVGSTATIATVSPRAAVLLREARDQRALARARRAGDADPERRAAARERRVRIATRLRRLVFRPARWRGRAEPVRAQGARTRSSLSRWLCGGDHLMPGERGPVSGQQRQEEPRGAAKLAVDTARPEQSVRELPARHWTRRRPGPITHRGRYLTARFQGVRGGHVPRGLVEWVNVCLRQPSHGAGPGAHARARVRPEVRGA